MRSIRIIVSIGMSLMLGIIANPLMVLATPGVDEHTKLFLRFDDGSGNKVKDLSGNDNDGTVEGAEWVDGKFGKALLFEDDDFVEVLDSDSLDIVEQITIEAWANPADNDGGYVLLKQGAYGAPKFIAGSVYFYIRSVGQDVVPFVDGHVEVNQWHHYAATYDGEKICQYVDGELLTTTDRAGLIEASGQRITIGHSFGWHAGGDRNYAGMIDDVRVSDVARTPEEIAEAIKGFETGVDPGAKLAVSWGRIKGETGEYQ